MSPIAALVAVWGAAAIAMTLGWWWQYKHVNAGIVDVIWAAGLAAAALLYAMVLDGAPLPRALLAACGGLWGMRLAWHLVRRVCSEPEDGRYRQLRKRWQGQQGKIFLLFQFQAGLIGLFSLPFLAVARNRNAHLAPWALLAAAIWIVSLLGEARADRQLARFRADAANRGKTCRRGLWRYSRHPNYFFEWLHWWTYVALAAGGAWFGLSWCGPLLMYAFLRWISGIPFTEAQALRSRGADYRSYQMETPMLFPWFPKRRFPRNGGSP